MYLFLVLSVMMLSACAVPQLAKYSHLEAEYGVIPFEIATDKFYPSDWQRINGDPHGQAAEKEAPDALGDETLSFDFPKDKNGSYYELYLWTHSASGLEMTGIVTELLLLSLSFENDDFTVSFDDSSIEVSNSTYFQHFNYEEDFNVLLDTVTEARVSSTNVRYNVRFEFLDYVFIIIGTGGIYEPDYDVTGNVQQQLSVTMTAGDVQQMGALMGQIDGYWIYAPSDPKHGDLALAKAVINGDLTPPFAVRRSRHLGRYKTCWHYGAGTNTRHAIIGNLVDFYVPA